jgi:Iodothyronine deiodinase
VLFATPLSFEDRANVGATCVKALKVDLPMVVDEIDNRTERAYTAWPDRLYVIDAAGTITYKSRPGPFGFKIEPVAKALAALAGPAITPPRPS